MFARKVLHRRHVGVLFVVVVCHLLMTRKCRQVAPDKTHTHTHAHVRLTALFPGLWRGTVVERRSLAGELSQSCARPAADG